MSDTTKNVGLDGQNEQSMMPPWEEPERFIRDVGEKENRYAASWVSKLVGFAERLNVRFSRFGNLPVYRNSDFPWVREIEANWEVIEGELGRVMNVKDHLPNFHDITSEVRHITNDNNWKTFFLVGYGVETERNSKMCPETVKLLRQIPGMKTAFFSILSPGKHIPVHRGPYNGVLRYHLGLRVPREREKCRIWIQGHIHAWAPGESLIFDDTFLHAVRNETEEWRAILFVDFARPVRFPFSLVNAVVLRLARFFPILQEAKQNQDKWEKEFYGQHGTLEDAAQDGGQS